MTSRPLTRAQVATLLDVACDRVTRNRDWLVYGARSDVLERLEERDEPLVEWAGPVPGHRRGDDAPGPVRLTAAGRRELGLPDEPRPRACPKCRGHRQVFGDDWLGDLEDCPRCGGSGVERCPYCGMGPGQQCEQGGGPFPCYPAGNP